MPELPEVEILARHLAPLLKGKKIREILVQRTRTIAPTTEEELSSSLKGATFVDLSRRGKYLLFRLRREKSAEPFTLLGHLGMTGRMYLENRSVPLPKHAPVVFDLGREKFIFEDTRYFGRLTLDLSGVAELGPEPFGPEFSAKYLEEALKRSAQAIKVKLLDQHLIAGIGNIYASETLFHARISPTTSARKLNAGQVKSLHRAIPDVLTRAIRCGSSIPLDFGGKNQMNDRTFYYGSTVRGGNFHEERFRVYDREGSACLECGQRIRKIVQGARSTFYCAHCQRA